MLNILCNKEENNKQIITIMRMIWRASYTRKKVAYVMVQRTR